MINLVGKIVLCIFQIVPTFLLDLVVYDGNTFSTNLIKFFALQPMRLICFIQEYPCFIVAGAQKDIYFFISMGEPKKQMFVVERFFIGCLIFVFFLIQLNWH